MDQNLIFFVERERKRQQPPGSDPVSALMSALTGGMLALQQQLPQQQLPPLQQQLLPPPMLPILPQQLIAESQLTEVMAMDVGMVETGQSDELMTDGSGAQQLGSKGPTEDAEAT